MTIPILVSSSPQIRFIVRDVEERGPLRISLPRKKLRHTDISGASARSW